MNRFQYLAKGEQILLLGWYGRSQTAYEYCCRHFAAAIVGKRRSASELPILRRCIALSEAGEHQFQIFRIRCHQPTRFQCTDRTFSRVWKLFDEKFAVSRGVYSTFQTRCSMERLYLQPQFNCRRKKTHLYSLIYIPLQLRSLKTKIMQTKFNMYTISSY